MSTKTEIEEFLDGPLVTWFRSCLHDPMCLTDYDDLADGVLLHGVLLLIDPEPVHHGVGPSLGNPSLRTKNMDCIIKNIKTLYEEELCQLVLKLPDASILGRQPESKAGLENMSLLLLLLLGCAVQCPNKQAFIERIKTLPIDAQHSLVDCIKQVTESQEIVLTPEASELVPNDLLINHIKALVKQRDLFMQLNGISNQDEKKNQGCIMSGSESQHLAVELADWKAKLRKQRQELEEKSESLSEAKEELECNKTLIAKLKSEINELKTEARVGKAYRDEADSLREKAERAERLEAEVARYREKLSDLDYYRSRTEELRQDNRVLEETREMLEEQLARARTRVEYTVQLEADILSLKQTINDLSLEREANQEKLQELFEENAQLALLSKSALNQDNSLLDEQLAETSVGEGDNSLCEQLSSNAQARALRLELENRRLASTVESLQDAALHQTNERILQLEKEKKKLSLQVEEYEDAKKKLMLHISEMETTVKNAQRDTKKMQDIRDSLESQLQSRVEEIEMIQREKSRLEKRAIEAEELLERNKAKEIEVEEVNELKCKAGNLEKEIVRLKQTVESKAVDVDKLQCELDSITKEKSQLIKQLEEVNAQNSRLCNVEKEWKELLSKYEVDKATLATLHKELVQEKMVTQRLISTLEKLGLPVEQLADPENAIDRIISSPEIVRAVQERLGSVQEDEIKDLAAENARLEVELATLQSQVTSLTSQHTAQKLANSQLVAEKDELSKNHENLRDQHQQLLLDQLTLQRIHEQLSTQYETISKERESLRNELKKVRSEARAYKESIEKLEASIEAKQAQIDKLSSDSACLINYRQEHSKLKEDFRNLFTASEKLKTEYRNSQEECKTLKNEVRKLSLALTEAQGKMSTLSDNKTHLEVHLSKLNNEVEILKEVKMNLEEDRKSLMEHVTLLLGQYHALLTHSLEDKDHYHMEEKLFTDQVNNLCRQKEKLEEKIMEQYRKMDSCPSKKKSFGASLVRRVRKAGSDLISKSRRSWHEDAARRGSATIDRGGTDSDTSLEDVRTRQDGLGLGNPGTRRTVYLSGDENSACPNEQNDNKSHTLPADSGPRSSSPQDSHQNPLVVYNRVTAVLGNNATPPQSPVASQSSRKLGGTPTSTPNKMKSDVWYEYGCV
ncbi:hypothetical protein O3M35_003028 [Rhynocoris fuscipes]|uniref:Calponin-homology (CH) domain-containing protein n=1 Tax=Rhynocoris fuscipes TaxID=488301 RepID=A0AAW1CIZ1_9HEMI